MEQSIHGLKKILATVFLIHNSETERIHMRQSTRLLKKQNPFCRRKSRSDRKNECLVEWVMLRQWLLDIHYMHAIVLNQETNLLHCWCLCIYLKSISMMFEADIGCQWYEPAFFIKLFYFYCFFSQHSSIVN